MHSRNAKSLVLGKYPSDIISYVNGELSYYIHEKPEATMLVNEIVDKTSGVFYGYTRPSNL